MIRNKRRTPEDIAKKYAPKLAGPLRFGDPKQIIILDAWRAELAELDELNDPDQPLREWRVGYTYTVEDEDVVVASTEKEARLIAEEEFCGGDDFLIEWIKEVKVLPKKQEDERQLWLNQRES
jgi:hypothetical protein